MRIDYDEVRRIHRLERTMPQLVDVDADFFESLRDFFVLEKKRFVDEADSMSESKSREFGNLRKMIEEIMFAREKKLLNKALAMARTGDSMPVRIADVEKKVLAELVDILREYSSAMNGYSNASHGAMSAKKDFNSVAVRIVKDIPAFVGADRASYGPFVRSSVIELPPAIAEVLLKRKLAEQT